MKNLGLGLPPRRRDHGVVPLMRATLGDRRLRFLDALAQAGVDPARGFWNPLLRRVLVDEPPVG
jgi:hypothetical protein